MSSTTTMNFVIPMGAHPRRPRVIPGRWTGVGWFESLRHLWQWDELAAEIGQESQSRVVFAGLTGAGKSLLFNRLRGWVVSKRIRRQRKSPISISNLT